MLLPQNADRCSVPIETLSAAAFPGSSKELRNQFNDSQTKFSEHCSEDPRILFSMQWNRSSEFTLKLAGRVHLLIFLVYLAKSHRACTPQCAAGFFSMIYNIRRFQIWTSNITNFKRFEQKRWKFSWFWKAKTRRAYESEALWDRLVKWVFFRPRVRLS